MGPCVCVNVGDGGWNRKTIRNDRYGDFFMLQYAVLCFVRVTETHKGTEKRIYVLLPGSKGVETTFHL